MDGAWTQRTEPVAFWRLEPPLTRRHIKCLRGSLLASYRSCSVQQGEDEHMIAFRLGWNLDAMHVYLRDC
jgi:hypothetical protein